MESHDMIDNIERYIKEGLHIEFTAHMDPVELDNPLISQLYKEIIQTIKPLEGVHSIHDLRIVPGKTHTNVIFDAVLTPSCKMSEDEISRLVDAKLKQINPTYFVVITFDKAYTET